MNEIKDRIFHDAISTAIKQNRIIAIQKCIIAFLVACIGFLLAFKGV